MRSYRKTLSALTLCFALLTGCAWQTSGIPDALPAQISAASEQTAAPKESRREEPVSCALAYHAAAGMNPYSCTDVCNRLILELVYEPLFAVTAEGEVQPVLAESWSVSADGLTTSVTLRQGVAFQRGGTLTAADAAASFTEAAAGSVYGGRLRHIVRARAADTFTVEFTTDIPYGCLPLLLDFPIRHAGASVPDGTGPYCFSERELTAFSACWHGNLPLASDTVLLLPVDSVEALHDSFQYGGVSLVMADELTYVGDYDRRTVTAPIMQYLGFRLDGGIFADASVRSALCRAIDREAVVKQSLGGSGVSAVLASVPGSRWYPQELAEKQGYDPSRLTAALPWGGEASLLVNADSLSRTAAAEQIAAMLSDCGLHVTVRALPAAEFANALQEGNFDFYYAETRLSPDQSLASFFSEGSALCLGGLAEQTEAARLCELTAADYGNAYELHEEILRGGLLCPIAFRTQVLCSRWGALTEYSPYLDWNFLTIQ